MGQISTPIDEDAFFHKGIHALLDISEKKSDYFGTDEVQLGVEKSESILEAGINGKPLYQARIFSLSKFVTQVCLPCTQCSAIYSESLII